MRISRTPFRISFVGGGSDLPQFYQREGMGAVVSASINKYMYLSMNPSFDEKIRLMYSRYEIADSIDTIEHPIVRAAFNRLGIHKGLEISSLADVSKGTGLGSSSAYTVGLLNALSSFLNKPLSKYDLASLASKIEIEDLGSPIGKQDQFAAAFGGINKFEFNSDESVAITPIVLSSDRLIYFQSHLMLFFTGRSRDAASVLSEQKNHMDTEEYRNIVKEMVSLTDIFSDILSCSDITDLGIILHENWELKKRLSKNISDSSIDEMYNIARKNGATGGKILGAGNGGFLLIFAKPEYQLGIASELSYLRKIDFSISFGGSEIIKVL
jgi:D-glycero-alpha-D-manno-heptose-7-phosphate kinase